MLEDAERKVESLCPYGLNGDGEIIDTEGCLLCGNLRLEPSEVRLLGVNHLPPRFTADMSMNEDQDNLLLTHSDILKWLFVASRVKTADWELYAVQLAAVYTQAYVLAWDRAESEHDKQSISAQSKNFFTMFRDDWKSGTPRPSTSLTSFLRQHLLSHLHGAIVSNLCHPQITAILLSPPLLKTTPQMRIVKFARAFIPQSRLETLMRNTSPDDSDPVVRAVRAHCIAGL